MPDPTTTTAPAAASCSGRPLLGDIVLPASGSGHLVGSWLRAFWVAVPGPVRSKSNHRQGAKSRWAQIAAYETQVFAAVTAARPAGWDIGDASVPVKARPKVVAVLAARSLLDVGNLSKSVLDACEGRLFVSDAQVAGLAEFATRDSQMPGLVAAFAQLAADTTAGQCAAAVADLLRDVTGISCPPR